MRGHQQVATEPGCSGALADLCLLLLGGHHVSDGPRLVSPDPGVLESLQPSVLTQLLHRDYDSQMA